MAGGRRGLQGCAATALAVVVVFRVKGTVFRALGVYQGFLRVLRVVQGFKGLRVSKGF